MHLVQASWSKRLKTSVIVFLILCNSFLYYSMFTLILRHFGFVNYTVNFFPDYLVDRSTQYSWNFFLFKACNANVSIEQTSTLFSILSVLYIVSIIHIFEIRTQALNLSTFIFLLGYRVVITLMVLFSLVMKYNKIEVFHFFKTYNNSNLELDLLAISILILKPNIY